MKNTMTQGLLSAALVGLASMSAFAATDGTISGNNGNSTGTVVISAEVPKRVRISGLENVTFGDLGGQYNTAVGANDISNTQGVCIWSTSRSYSLTATGTAAGFELAANTASNPALPYSVSWAEDASATAVALDSGVQYPNNFATNNESSDCRNDVATNQAQLTVTISGDDIEKALADSYSGTLTIEVSAI